MVTITFDGLELGAVFPDWTFYFGEIHGRDYIAPDVSSIAYKGTHGSRFVNQRYPARNITVDVTIVAGCENMQNLNESLMSVLTADTPRKLTFSDTPGYWNAIVSNIDMTEHYTYAEGTITFTCLDPFRYGANATMNLTELTPLIGVNTNYNVLPRLTLYPTAAASGLNVTVTDRTLTIDKTVKQGDVIVIDSEQQRVTINDKVIVLEVSGEYPLLTHMNNYVQINPVSCTGEVYYVSRWI